VAPRDALPQAAIELRQRRRLFRMYAFLRATLSRRRRVARGQASIDARLDLHGMTQKQAHAALLHFLHQARAQDAKLALVVTGKGMGGATGSATERGALRRQVPLWLALPEFRRFIVSFEQAHDSQGGGGALYLRLRRRPR